MPDKKKKSVSVIRSSAIIKNPVLFEAIGIAPVVAMAVSLKSAIILSFVSLVELLLIECLACLLMKKLKGSVRKMIYAIFLCLCFSDTLPPTKRRAQVYFCRCLR